MMNQAEIVYDLKLLEARRKRDHARRRHLWALIRTGLLAWAIVIAIGVVSSLSGTLMTWVCVLLFPPLILALIVSGCLCVPHYDERVWASHAYEVLVNTRERTIDEQREREQKLRQREDDAAYSHWLRIVQTEANRRLDQPHVES